uniref:Putative L-type lectin-domain containing receptor kinase S.5 n=1 Tax=Populus alba TaxID=43335 RepID=A0A4U5NKQ8_POPAL|nr:putative L-type lectin-domain containing receptor kinase S.5 [Populus alba]
MRFPLVAPSVILAVLWALALVQSLHFQFPIFTESDRDQLILTPMNSNIASRAIQVTLDSIGAPMENLSGRVLYKWPFRLWSNGGKNASFNTTFVLNIKNQTASSGEGLAFILTADPDVPDGSEGQWLGIVNSTLNGSKEARTVAVEFDTSQSYPDDLDDNHIGLDVNSIYSRRSVSLNDRGIYISKGEDIAVDVRYDGKNLTVFVGGDMKNPVISEHLNLSDYLPENVYVGFSGSTSNNTQLNCVKSWKFSGSEIKDSKLRWVWILVAVGSVLILLISIGIALFLCRKRGCEVDRLEDAYPNIDEAILGSSTAPRKRGTILEGADPRLDGIFKNEEMECVLILGLACCHPNPNDRPSMKTVLQVLTGEAPPPDVPAERPVFMWPPNPPSFKEWGNSIIGGDLSPFSELSGR